MANVTEVTSVTDRDILSALCSGRFEKFYAGTFTAYIEGDTGIDPDDILASIRGIFGVPKQKEN